MTPSQRIYLQADLWPNACKVQGWNVQDRELRLTVCSIAVNVPIQSIKDWSAAFYGNAPLKLLKSTNEIGTDAEFTRVKALLLMLADKLGGAQEIDQPQINKARQKTAVIEEQIRCLAVYPLEAPMGAAGATKYVAEIIRDKFKGGSRAMPLQIGDLGTEPIRLRDGRTIPSQQEQLLFTLRSRLHNKRTGLRVQAGDSLHDMNLRVGLKCSCKQCCEVRVTLNRGDAERGDGDGMNFVHSVILSSQH